MTTIETQVAGFFTVDRAMHATPLTAPEYRPSPAEIVAVLMEHFDESREVVIDWLLEFNFSGVK